jgi:hypothetical protein
VDIPDRLAGQATGLAVEAAMVEQVGVEAVEHGGVDRLEPYATQVRDHVEPEVALVRCPRRFLDRDLDRWEPVVGQELT